MENLISSNLIQYRHKCGIYLIEIETYKYIGSSKELYSRLREHRYDLVNEKHSNNLMTKIFKKYGYEKTMFKIIEYCEPINRIEREKYWINEYESNMNLKDPISNELSLESRKKISDSLKKAYKEKRKHTKAFKKVDCYDIKGKYLKTYESAIEAAKDLNCSVHTVNTAAAEYSRGRTIGFNRLRYSDSKTSVIDFEYQRPSKLTSKFKYQIIQPDNIIIDVKLGIKELNNAILDQLYKGNYEFKIKAIPNKSPKIP